jgi:uncharacterized protein YbjT (DUF2867 family)
MAILGTVTKLPVLPIPTGVLSKPMDPDEVAARLVELAVGEPAGRVPDISGPEVMDAIDMVRTYLRATHRRRLIVPFRMPGKAMAAIRAGALLPKDDGSAERVGRGRTWARYLAQQLG